MAQTFMLIICSFTITDSAKLEASLQETASLVIPEMVGFVLGIILFVGFLTKVSMAK